MRLGHVVFTFISVLGMYFIWAENIHLYEIDRSSFMCTIAAARVYNALHYNFSKQTQATEHNKRARKSQINERCGEQVVLHTYHAYAVES